MHTLIRAAALTATAAALAIGGTVTAPASTAAAVAQLHPMPSGISYLPARVNLQPTASGTWVDTRLAVTLPEAGTYSLDLNVRTRLSGVPPVNTYIVGRLRNATANTVLPRSARILNQIADHTRAGNGAGHIGQNTTSPISERITVDEPTRIVLEVRRINSLGHSTAADVWNDGNGLTSFRFTKTA
ncbi:hypothetical protein [Nonomuraea ceibae]|uniref:hypothetical protein n=1 Tax=Nonomuraea ceibae TaxID=1935170 RepID=UPI001C60211B|nr:hypothetical protein [Nonomuraea ceibae]